MDADSPNWLAEATEALEYGQKAHTIELIEAHAFQIGVSPREKREAYRLAKQIEIAAWAAAGVRERASEAVSRLVEWGDSEEFANAERERRAELAEQRRRAELAEQKRRAELAEQKRRADLAARERRAELAAAERKRRAKLDAAECKRRAEFDARTADLEALGLPRRRVEMLARLEGGPYDVVLTGLRDDYDFGGISSVLEELGYKGAGIGLLLERVRHISPEPVAHLLHQSVAVRFKLALEGANAKVRIKAR